MSEINRKRLYELLLKKPENNVCADCNDKDPLWASTTFGVFLCTQCASIHRQLTVSISRVKSLKLDNWDQCHVVTMEENGNKAAKALYEKCVPPYYRRPKQDDVQVLKEQWIRAKYERKEFMEPVKTCYSESVLEGFLMKRGKKDGKFYPRLFILSKNEGNLKYFVHENKKYPKAVINVEHLNATFCPVKIQNPNGLQLTYQKDGFTRSIFVYTERGKEIVDWYNAIRAARLHRLQIAFPTKRVEELVPFLTRDFIYEGELYKTGPRVGDTYKKRWFILDDRRLMYMENPLDAYPKGEIFLGEKYQGYSVKSGIPSAVKEYKYGFSLITPERTWLIGAETEEIRESWIHAINQVIEKQPQPQDYTESWRNDLRNSYSYKKSRNSDRHSGSSFTGTLRKGGRFFTFSS